MCTRFFTLFDSGTLTNTSLMSRCRGSPDADIHTHSRSRCGFHPRAAAQNSAVRSTSLQSTLISTSPEAMRAHSTTQERRRNVSTLDAAVASGRLVSCLPNSMRCGRVRAGVVEVRAHPGVRRRPQATVDNELRIRWRWAGGHAIFRNREVPPSSPRWQRETGLEPATTGLEGQCSTS